MRTFLRSTLSLFFLTILVSLASQLHPVYAVDCVVNVDPYSGSSITPVTITGNKYGCVANIVVFCDGSNGQPDPRNNCGLAASCIVNPPGESITDTECIVGIPTSTPAPTNTPKPTATPTPDPSLTCPDPNGGTPYNNGSLLCGSYDDGSQRYSVSKCINGQFKDAGYCMGRYTISIPPGDACKTKGGPNGDTCDNQFIPLPTPNPLCEVVSEGQLLPQPGENCGIPPDEPVGLTPNGEPIIDPTSPKHMCCNSVLGNVEVPPLSCVFNNAPDIIKDNILDPIGEKMNEVVNRMPFFVFGPDSALSYGRWKTAFKDQPACVTGAAPSSTPGSPSCTCTRSSIPVLEALSKYCDNIKDASEQNECKDCIGKKVGNNFVAGKGIYTGLGCISIKEDGLIQSILRLGVSLGGAMALFCILYGAFLFQRSAGSPESIKKAQELITSCITGLLLIIFSVFILRLIGYNILRIPGFS